MKSIELLPTSFIETMASLHLTGVTEKPTKASIPKTIESASADFYIDFPRSTAFDAGRKLKNRNHDSCDSSCLFHRQVVIYALMGDAEKTWKIYTYMNGLGGIGFKASLPADLIHAHVVCADVPIVVRNVDTGRKERTRALVQECDAGRQTFVALGQGHEGLKFSGRLDGMPILKPALEDLFE